MCTYSRDCADSNGVWLTLTSFQQLIHMIYMSHSPQPQRPAADVGIDAHVHDHNACLYVLYIIIIGRIYSYNKNISICIYRLYVIGFNYYKYLY